eukprot:TRINITY_DN10361_c0_g1_i2.p1 TRINITY_DN10361_c0_g1~~TRINITY_DN10361_c0_g1_i2.p1  ORF type:complete len:266 (+),score=14.00 TRINITY_DN10361_c0_g1_i2:46-843(+)
MRRSFNKFWRSTVPLRPAKKQRVSRMGNLLQRRKFSQEAPAGEVNGLKELFEQVKSGLPEKLDSLLPAMQRVRWEDLKLAKPQSTLDEVACMVFHKTEEYTLCYFFIPPGKKLPLHDHPGMDIIQKVVLGKVRVRGFDWVQHRYDSQEGTPLSSDATEEGTAFEVYNEVFTPQSEATRIHPNTGGILHEIAAEGDEVAGFLDFITPPYDPDSRDCTYFSASPLSQSSDTPDRTFTHPIYRLTPIAGYDGVPMYSYRTPQLSWMDM